MTDLRTFTTPVGTVLARHEDDVVRALGIPYAQADRFAAPRPVPAFTEPFEALSPAPVAPQPESGYVGSLLQPMPGVMSDEHCQRLSITMPADVSADERLPVMMWIHGGSYVIGGGDLPIYDPRELVIEQRVVVVTVTFRLGVLGFLGGPTSSDRSTRSDRPRADVPANLGLLDLVEALRWVRTNISAFGGDPDLVTVFGQSAGGDATAHLMISDGAQGLFRRAIIQSAPLGISRRRAGMTRALLRAVGPIDRDTPVDEVIARQVAAERAAAPFGLRGGMPFGTQYGHTPLPTERRAPDAWRSVAPEIDVLIGSAADEAAMFLPAVPALRAAVRSRPLRALVRWLLVRPLSEIIYGRDVRRFRDRHRAAGGHAVSYRLRHGATTRPTGAVHMSDLPLLLGGRDAWAGSPFVAARDWPAVEERGRRLRAVWAEFARTGRVDAPDDTSITFDRG